MQIITFAATLWMKSESRDQDDSDCSNSSIHVILRLYRYHAAPSDDTHGNIYEKRTSLDKFNKKPFSE